MGHPNTFQQVSRIGFIAATSVTGGQPNFARCLDVSWAATLYIHFRGLLPPDGILPRAKCTLRPSLAFSYILACSVTVRHSNSGVSKTLRRGARNRITELSQMAPPIFGYRRPSRWASAHILVILFLSLPGIETGRLLCNPMCYHLATHVWQNKRVIQ